MYLSNSIYVVAHGKLRVVQVCYFFSSVFKINVCRRGLLHISRSLFQACIEYLSDTTVVETGTVVWKTQSAKSATQPTT